MEKTNQESEFRANTKNDRRINLRSLDDVQLEISIKEKVRLETNATTAVLHHLAEIQRRRLYAARGYSSLFEYATKALGYSEGAAYRRINAMKLISSIPEVEEKISSGKLSLSTAATVQSFFTKKSKADEKPIGLIEKKEILDKVQGKTKRECERSLYQISPLAVPQEKERVLTDDKTELRFVADRDLMDQLEKIKNLVSHKNPNPSYAELFKIMAGEYLKKKSLEENVASNANKNSAQVSRPSTRGLVAAKFQAKGLSGLKNGRYIPKAYRRELWRRSSGRCEYIDLKTKRRCECQSLLEVDHIQPLALGGKTELVNLRILCREHNLLAASQILGFKNMEKYRRVE